MSSVDNPETKFCSILCTCEHPRNNHSQLSTEDNDSKYCDNVTHLNNEESSHIATVTPNSDKYSLKNKYIQNTYMCKCSHVAFSYLGHLTTFGWQRRKRRRLPFTKEEQNAFTGATNLLLFLVLSSSFLLSPINANVSYPPESIRLSSYIPPYNVSYTSQTQYLVPSSDNTEATALNWLDDKNNMPSKFGEGALISRTPRGNKF